MRQREAIQRYGGSSVLSRENVTRMRVGISDFPCALRLRRTVEAEPASRRGLVMVKIPLPIEFPAPSPPRYTEVFYLVKCPAIS